MRIRDRLGVSRRRQEQVSRAMQLALVGFLFVGVDRGNPGIVVNAGVALAVTELPALLERDYELSMDPAVVLWITAAVFLHALGTLGPYQDVAGWDHVTHALSSSVVAGVGYAFVRAVDQHVADVEFPPSFVFVFILLVVVAFGVGWEVIEFAIGRAAALVGTARVLTQYGLDDTMLDLVFDLVGGFLTAVWGAVYVTDLSDQLGRLLLGDAGSGE